MGGEDKPIEAYQRPVKSGSQALMVGYTNEKNALGYSVYYYAQNMYNMPDLRLMAVDGVMPSEKTIADGSYPFLNEFYAVIRKNEPEEGPVRRLLNWILSDEGRQTIRDAGYVGLS